MWNIFLFAVIGLIVFDFLLERIMDALNLKNIRPDIPEEFKGVYDEEKYAKSQSYLKDNTRFGTVQDCLMLPITLAFILLGGFAWVDGLAGQLVGEGVVQRGLVFIFLLVLLGQLVGIPFSLYSTFVIEEKYGFNKTTQGTFWLDLVKGLLLGVVIGAPILALIIWFFDRFELAWLYVWIAVAAYQFFLLYISPVVIMPLFNKFTPLEDGELKDAIEAYTEKQGFTLSGIFTVDGSRRSSKTNAYFTGFGRNRRVALFDTLVEKHENAELLGVLAHEIGHYKLKHIFKMMVVSIGYMGLMFFIMSLFLQREGMYQAFQVEGTPVYAGLVFFSFLFKPINLLLSVFMNILSRKHEFEADAFAATTTGESQPMIDALKKLSVDNLSNLSPHPFVVFMEYSHPPVLERVKALRAIGASRGNTQ